MGTILYYLSFFLSFFLSFWELLQDDDGRKPAERRVSDAISQSSGKGLQMQFLETSVKRVQV
jgi:hypothetical protein